MAGSGAAPHLPAATFSPAQQSFMSISPTILPAESTFAVTNPAPPRATTATTTATTSRVTIFPDKMGVLGAQSKLQNDYNEGKVLVSIKCLY